MPEVKEMSEIAMVIPLSGLFDGFLAILVINVIGWNHLAL